MPPVIKKHASKFRFAAVGVLNTAIDFGLLYALVGVGLGVYPANYISTTCAFLFSFFANRRYTFRSSGVMHRQILPFLAVTAFGLWVLQPLVIGSVLFLWGSQTDISLLVSKLIATIVTLIWNYILYSRFVFKDKS